MSHSGPLYTWRLLGDLTEENLILTMTSYPFHHVNQSLQIYNSTNVFLVYSLIKAITQFCVQLPWHIQLFLVNECRIIICLFMRLCHISIKIKKICIGKMFTLKTQLFFNWFWVCSKFLINLWIENAELLSNHFIYLYFLTKVQTHLFFNFK